MNKLQGLYNDIFALFFFFFTMWLVTKIMRVILYESKIILNRP